MKPYSLETCLAVLRLYALQPASARPDTVAKILLKALCQLPAADYKTCAYLVPERLQVAARRTQAGQTGMPPAVAGRQAGRPAPVCSCGQRGPALAGRDCPTPARAQRVTPPDHPSPTKG